MNMQFVNSRKNNYPSFNNTITNNQYTMISRKNNTNRPFVQSKPQEIIPVPQNNPKKIKWGQPTWYLFHTLAHKIKDEYFSLLKNELLTNIISICRNLPCPKCSTHASEYMNKININSIQTKNDLKNMLFKFHNDVNSRTGASLFSYNDLDDKYSTAVTVNIIQNFFIYFQDKSFNVTAIANTMHRERVISVIKNWLAKNIQYFDL
jgi:hypothetical protein